MDRADSQGDIASVNPQWQRQALLRDHTNPVGR